MSNNVNAYQMAKARKIAAFLQDCASKTKQETRPYELAKIVTLMSPDEWRTVSFHAGVPMAELECKAVVLAVLRSRVPQVVGK